MGIRWPFYTFAWFAGLLFAGCSTDSSQRAGDQATEVGARSLSGEDWLIYYYQRPQPEQLVEEMYAMAREGLLSEENSRMPLIGFLSAVFEEHPSRIPEWMASFEEIADAELSGIYDALWYANNDEARSYLQASMAADAYRDLPPDLDTMPIDSPKTLDFFWGRFFATGDGMPIRRIVTALEYGRYQGAGQRYMDAMDTAKSDALAYEFYMESIFAAAMWSLEMNSKEHRLVKEYCEGLLRGDQLTQNEYAWLAIVLSKVSPELWEVQFKEDGAYVVDRRGEPEQAESWDDLLAKVSSLNAFVGSYPPRFANTAEKKQVVKRWKALLKKVKADYVQYPDAETVLYLLSELYRQGHNMDVAGAGREAGKLYERGLRMYPRSIEINMSAAYFYLSIDPQFAHLGEACLHRLREVVGDQHPEVERGLVYAHLYQGREKEAIEQIDRYLAIKPGDEVMTEIKNALLNGKMKIRVDD